MRSTLDKIREEAAGLDPVRVALTLVAAPFFAAGWLASRVAKAVWTVLAWAWTAAVVGWRAARGED